MYMRAPPNSLAPAPGIPIAAVPGNNGLSSHSVRFYELLDALKMEYDLTTQQSNSSLHPETANKMSPSDYEAKGKG